MQRRTLIRGRTLADFREAIVELALEPPALAARRRAVVVPTRASAEILRQTIESRLGHADPGAAILPDVLTRDEVFARLADGLPGRPRLLPRLEREVLLERAARAAAGRSRLGSAPFPLRPGLVGALLDFYDELVRRQRPVRRFARTLFDQLRGELGTDRGSEHLIRQTAFLGFAFLAYERGVAASGGLDEHALRRALVRTQPALPIGHLVVAVADHPSDPRGLWPDDFDTIGRLEGLARIDVVMTDETHDAGFRDRLERELPGIVEDRRASSAPRPGLVRPPAPEEPPGVVSRDREEELREVARAIRRRSRESAGELRDATAIVFQRPLPYLYLSQQVLAEARVPYQAFDALPLGAEPYAALLDLVMTMARTGGTREAAVALLRSGLMRFDVDRQAVTTRDVAALDAVLADRRSIGEATSYPAEIDAYVQRRDGRQRGEMAGARRAALAAATVHRELRPFRDAARASEQVRALAAVLRRHERAPAADDARRERHARARAAVLGVLDGLALAYERHDDRPRPHDDLIAAIRHSLEAHTFMPRRGATGVHLVDAVAARFGEFQHAHIVGLVDTEWPERPRRSIFYTSGLLKALGWPQEPEQARAQLAAFRDLLGLPSRTITLHAFRLEGDAAVALSPMIEAARDLPAIDGTGAAPARIFDDEVLTGVGERPAGLAAEPAAWLDLRMRRPGLDDPRYRGFVVAQPPQPYRVSRVDRYVDCPFKYFAESVLDLPEERDAAVGLTPLERGTLVHTLFERFYREWSARPAGTITPETLPEALAVFTRLTEDELARLPEADRALERTRLLGSIVGRGAAERVFELEADAGGEVVQRLLEFPLKGTFDFPQLGGLTSRPIAIHGKADRIDVFDDGSLRVIDYKLSRLPDPKSSIQIAVYAWAAAELLRAGDGRAHTVRAALYLAFGDDDRFEGAIGSRDERPEMAVAARAAAFADVVARIEGGQFPPRPRRIADCAWCRYSGVCRKEYAGEDDDAAESV